jgi:HEAT repeat protein
MTKATENPTAEELNRAFEPLPGYNTGSDRALLLPLDRIAASSLVNPGLRTELEKRLIAWLKSNLSPVALEYVLSKLAVTGSEVCVPAVAVLLPDARLSTAARNVLEALPGSASVKALRLSLPKLRGWQLIGVINSLGVRRDPESVGALARILQQEDALTQAAATDALGRIGTASAANALQKAYRSAPLPRRDNLAHALLACARQLLATNEKKSAKGLCEWLQDPAQPAHIRSAARRLLADATLTRPQGGAI